MSAAYIYANAMRHGLLVFFAKGVRVQRTDGGLPEDEEGRAATSENVL